MAIDEGLVQILRDDLTDIEDISERRMFGGLVFLFRGHMLCGVHPGGAMFRVGKDREAAALGLDGAEPLAFTGRKMGGFIDVSQDSFVDDDLRAEWLSMALENARSLPPK